MTHQRRAVRPAAERRPPGWPVARADPIAVAAAEPAEPPLEEAAHLGSTGPRRRGGPESAARWPEPRPRCAAREGRSRPGRTEPARRPSRASTRGRRFPDRSAPPAARRSPTAHRSPPAGRFLRRTHNRADRRPVQEARRRESTRHRSRTDRRTAPEASQPHPGLVHLVVRPLLVRYPVADAACDELVQVAVGPSDRHLQQLVQLGQRARRRHVDHTQHPRSDLAQRHPQPNGPHPPTLPSRRVAELAVRHVQLANLTPAHALRSHSTQRRDPCGRWGGVRQRRQSACRRGNVPSWATS